MSDDPYGGRKPGCFDITLTVVAWVLAIVLCIAAAAS